MIQVIQKQQENIIHGAKETVRITQKWRERFQKLYTIYTIRDHELLEKANRELAKLMEESGVKEKLITELPMILSQEQFKLMNCGNERGTYRHDLLDIQRQKFKIRLLHSIEMMSPL